MAENGNSWGSFFSNPKFKQFASEGLADLGYGLTTGTNFGNALGAATQRSAQMEPYRALQTEKLTEKAKLEEQGNVTRSWLEQQGFTDLVPLVDAGQAGLAYSEALKRMQPGYGQGAATADWSRLNDGTLYNQRTGEVVPVGGDGGGPTTEYGLNPVYGQFSDGTYGLGVLGKDGTFKQVDTGDMTPFDPRTLATERAAGTATGTFGAGQENALPSVQIAVENAKNTINSIRNNAKGQDEQFGNILGIPQQMLPMIPGSARANLDVDIQQLSGQAFLQAREFLKGQGQITDFESGKAEAAISRAQVAAQKGDRAAFNRALDDFEAALDAGLAKVAAQAGRSARPAPAPVGQTSTGLQWTVSQ